MKVESRPLGGTALIEGLLRGAPDAVSFFPGDPADVEAYVRKATEVDERFTAEDRAHAASHVRGGGPRAQERLQAFLREGGYMVTTGQQPGLFGGPLFGLYKGLTAAMLARRLEEVLARPVLPVFWIASEDHDWDDVRSVHVLDHRSELLEVALPERARTPAPPVHRIRLGPEVDDVRERFVSLHPDTEHFPRWRALLEEAYHPGTTLAEGFRHVMEALLAPAGVFLVESHEPGMKARALPILLRELEETGDRVRDLKRRGVEIERAGYDLQVSILDGGANVFLEGPHGRERLFLDEDGFRYRSSGQRTTLREIAARVEDDPTVLSPNVLLRPVVESALLPTLSYVAGPGEAAYLPQAEPVFRAHGIGRPVVHPRAALFLMETKISKVVEKFGLALEDLALPHHELAGRLLREEVPPEARRALAALRGAMEAGAEQLGSALRSVDPTLRGPVDSMRTQSLGLLDDVEKKVVHSLKRENDIALAQIAKARAHLFPLGRPQERVLNPFYYLARYDEELIRKVEAAAAGAVLPPLPGER